MKTKLTGLECVALVDLWESSNGNGHDFGISTDLPNIPKASRGGVVASLVEKGFLCLEHNEFNQIYFQDKGKELFLDFENSAQLDPKHIIFKPSKAKGKKTMKTKKPTTKTETGRLQLFGFSITSVLRYLGKKKWSADRTISALKAVGAGAVSPITVRLQLKAGAEGERGAPAKLSSAQYKQLCGAGR